MRVLSPVTICGLVSMTAILLGFTDAVSAAAPTGERFGTSAAAVAVQRPADGAGQTIILARKLRSVTRGAVLTPRVSREAPADAVASDADYSEADDPEDVSSPAEPSAAPRSIELGASPDLPSRQPNELAPASAAIPAAGEPGKLTCFAGCDVPSKTAAIKSSARAERKLHAGQNAASPVPVVAANNGLTCIAGCGDSMPRSPASSTPDATSRSEPGSLTVMRGVTRSRTYGVQ